MLVEHGTLSELRHLHANTVEATYLSEPPDLEGVADVEDVHVHDGRIRQHITGSTDPLLKALAQAEVVAIQMREPSLEELFHAYYDEPEDAPTGAGV